MNRRNLWLASLIPLLLAVPAGGQPFDIETGSYYPYDRMAHPTVAMLAGGGFVAAWERWHDRFQLLPAHGSVVYDRAGSPAASSVWFTDGAGPILLAAHPGGGFTMAGDAYTLRPLGSLGRFGQRFDSLGRPLTKPYPLPGAPLAIAPGKAGRLLALLAFLSGEDSTMSLLRYGRWGQPLGSPLVVTTSWTSAALASDGYGRGIAAWTENSRLFVRRASADGRWLGGAFAVDPNLKRLPAKASVAAAPDGRFVVVWEGTGDGAGSGIFGRRFAANGKPRGAVFRVNRQTAGDQTLPKVAVQGDGRFLVVWQSPDPASRLRIYGQHYCANGSRLGSEMLVSAGDPYQMEVEPAVAAGAAGHYAVVWRRYTNPHAISGRLFTAP